MGLRIRLQDEEGNSIAEVSDASQHLNPLIPPLRDASYSCWRYVDEYGDTVFNRQQIKDFLNETDRLMRFTKSEEAKKLLMKVKRLARRCQKEPHLYLKFIGD